MKKSVIFVLMLVLSLVASAQTLPTEKVFFASDRMSYQLGDTIQIDGWLTRCDDKMGAPYSRYLYMELTNNKDSVLSRQKLVVDERGSFHTAMPIDFTVPYGIYFLRAYSKMMCNFGDITIPTYPIEISENGFTTNLAHGCSGCRIFPEGGKLTAGGIQNVSIYLTGDNGMPLQSPFSITDSNGTTLLSSATTPAGWQTFVMVPGQGEHYYVNVGEGNDHKIYALPEIDNASPALRVSQGRGKFEFRIDGQIPKGTKLFTYHRALGLMMIPVRQNGVVDVSNVGDGVVSVMLADSHNNVLSEAHLWKSTNVKLQHDAKISYLTGENVIADSIIGEKAVSSAVRFVPYDESVESVIGRYVPTAEAADFESDFVSELPFPREMAGETPVDRIADVNGWLLSATFQRLDIAKVMSEGWKMKYQPEVTNAIKGTVWGKGKNWKLKEGNIVAYQRSNAETFSAEIRKDGTFFLPIADYPKGDSFFVSAHDKKDKSDQYEYEFYGDTIPTVMNYRKALLGDTVSVTATDAGRQGFNWHGVNNLSDVVVTAYVKKDYAKEEKEFYGDKLITEDVMDKRNYQTFQQMIYHFSNYMKLVSSTRDDGLDETEEGTLSGPLTWHLYPTRVSTLSGKSEVKIYVDGVLTDATNAVNLNMQDIATVEYFTPAQSVARHPLCINGCLELTTKGFKPEAEKSKGVMYTPSLAIANYGAGTPKTISAPSRRGDYLMIVDYLSTDFTPYTIVRKVSVHE